MYFPIADFSTAPIPGLHEKRPVLLIPQNFHLFPLSRKHVKIVICEQAAELVSILFTGNLYSAQTVLL